MRLGCMVDMFCMIPAIEKLATCSRAEPERRNGRTGNDAFPKESDRWHAPGMGSSLPKGFSGLHCYVFWYCEDEKLRGKLGLVVTYVIG